MPAVDLGHSQIHYRLDGPSTGPLLVLSHALGTDLTLWDPQISVLTRTFRVLRYDLRGHGQSSLSSEPITIEGLAADVTALVREIRAARFSFCGISIGGLIGMQVALRQGERLDALVISNTAARIGTPENWDARINTVQTDGMKAVVEPALQRWFTAEFHSKHSADVERFRTCLANTPPDGYIACCKALRDADLRGLVSGIRPPTLVIAGSEDPATTVADAQFLVQNIRGSRYTALPASHLANVETAEDFSQSVFTFLAGRELFSKGMSVRRAVLGDTHVDRSLARSNEFNREFQDFITRYAWGEIWTRPGLPRHSRSLVTLAMMIALNRVDEFRMHVRAAFNNGVTRDEIKELLLQAAIYCGVPAANAAFHAAEEVFNEMDLSR